MRTLFKDTKIGRIPDDWKLVRFEDIGVTYGGLTNKNKGDFGKGKPYIPFLNIMNNVKIDLDYLIMLMFKKAKNKIVRKKETYFLTHLQKRLKKLECVQSFVMMSPNFI